MKSLKRLTIAAFCLLAAITCYSFGAPAGGALFLIAGIVFEGLSGIGYFAATKPRHNGDHDSFRAKLRSLS